MELLRTKHVTQKDTAEWDHFDDVMANLSALR